ncbi:MAG: F0F1 ATP synthase subunit B [Oscillospiraceae bacterium]|nr:F0F1 ATP synthase subunit B [Oscillospiraceae bacterium]
MSLNSLQILAAASGVDRLFGLDAQMLISAGIQILNALLLTGLLSWLLYNPVKKFMKKRSDNIAYQLENAQNTEEKSKEHAAIYKKQLDEIDHQRMDILSEAREKANRQSLQIIDDARQEARDMKSRAKVSIQSERERMDEEIRVHIIEVASAMAEKMVSGSIDHKAHDRLFAETLSQLEDDG